MNDLDWWENGYYTYIATTPTNFSENVTVIETDARRHGETRMIHFYDASAFVSSISFAFIVLSLLAQLLDSS